MGGTDEPPVKPCPKARARSGKRKVHDAHIWWAGEYLPVGELGFMAQCPGFQPPKETEKKMAEDSFHLGIESGVSAFTGEPFCVVLVNRERVGQMTPAEVRAMVLQWLQAAEAAESDAAVFAELRATGLDGNTAAAFLVALRKRRDPNGAPPVDTGGW